MNGTEWTEPGQGAKVLELVQLLSEKGLTVQRLASLPLGASTNLRLTGSPLTADDLKRIEQCEVMR